MVGCYVYIRPSAVCLKQGSFFYWVAGGLPDFLYTVSLVGFCHVVLIPRSDWSNLTRAQEVLYMCYVVMVTLLSLVRAIS